MKPQQAQIFDLPFFTPEFRQAWEEWLEYRSQRKLPKYVPVGLKATFSKLIKDSHNNEQKAIAIIQRALAGNWQGLHPDKAEVVQMVPKTHNSINTNQFMKRPKPAEARPMTDAEMDEWIKGWKTKQEINVFYIPLDFYDYLVKKKLLDLTNDQKNELLLKAIPFRKKLISDDIKAQRHSESYLSTFSEMEKSGLFTGGEPQQLKNLAKKLAVAEYLKK